MQYALPFEMLAIFRICMKGYCDTHVNPLFQCENSCFDSYSVDLTRNIIVKNVSAFNISWTQISLRVAVIKLLFHFTAEIRSIKLLFGDQKFINAAGLVHHLILAAPPALVVQKYLMNIENKKH
jgi:hypothetical protein